MSLCENPVEWCETIKYQISIKYHGVYVCARWHAVMLGLMHFTLPTMQFFYIGP